MSYQKHDICKVLHAYSGDTLKLELASGKQFNSKARWIETFSESSEDSLRTKWAQEARIYLEKHTVGREIVIFNYNEDENGLVFSDWYIRNNPRVSVAFLNSVHNLQYKIVLSGLAWICLPSHPFKITDRDFNLLNTLPHALTSAYRANRGFWKDIKSDKLK